MSNFLVGGARSFPKFVVAQLAYHLAYSDIGLGAVLGSIAFTLHVTVGLGLLNFKRHFSTQKEVSSTVFLSNQISSRKSRMNQ